MDKDSARQFLEQLSTEAAFRAQFRVSAAANARDIIDFALSKGLVFTASELREAVRDFPDYFVVVQMRQILRMPGSQQPAPTA